MMRQFSKSKLIYATALLATAISSNASADGFPERYAEPPAPAFTWTGFYFGLNAGAAWPDTHSVRFSGTDTGAGGLGSEIADGTTPTQPPLDWKNSFTGGAQAGYNLQVSSIVLGLEADLQWLHGRAEFSTDSTNPLRPTITTSAIREMNMLVTVRGRLGVALWERSLLYATGGLAIGDATLQIASTCPGCAPPRDVTSASAGTPIGWVIGGGYEAALTQRVSLKAEYLHYDLGQNHTTITYDYPGNTSSMTGKVRDEGNIVRVGINFKLGQPVDTIK
jgi:outer membrane immunogenic protein